MALTLIAIAACACLGGITVVAQQGIRSAEESVTGILGFESLSAPSSDILVPPVVDDGQMQQRLLSASAVGGGDLEISLAWNSLSDLDLQVLEPEGELITARHRQSQSGGVMDVDANPTLLSRAGEEAVHSGRQPRPEDVIPLPEEFVDLDRKLGLPPGSNPLETTTSGGSIRFTHYPVEHIYFDHAPKGKFTVYAHCYSWREPNVTPLPFTVQIRSKGHVVSETSGMAGPMSAIADGASPIQVCEFVLH